MQKEFDVYFYRRRKNQTLILAVIFLSGLMAYWLITTPQQDLMIAAITVPLISLFACLWAYYDGEELGQPTGIAWSISIFIFAPLALPVYFFNTRGFGAYRQFGGVILILFSISVIAYSILFIYSHSEIAESIWQNIKPQRFRMDL